MKITRQKLILLIWSCYFLVGCENRKDYILYDPDVVPRYACMEKEQLPVDALFPIALMPTRHYFITVHLSEDYFFKVFSRKDYSCLGTVLNKGRGPGELPSIGYVDQWEVMNDEVIIPIYDGPYALSLNIDQSLTQGTAVLSPLLKDGRDFDKKKLRGLSSINILSEDSLLLYLAPEPTISKPEPIVPYFLIYDKNTEEVSEPFPIGTIEGKNDLHFRTIHCITSSLSKDKRHIGIATRGLKSLQIVDLQTKAVKKVKFPDSPTRLETIDPMVFNFYMSKATERFFWTLQQRYNPSDKNEKSVIYLLGWDGQPQYTLVFEENLRTFCPSEEEEALYAVDTEENIYRYDLRDFYQKIK